jgi:alpha-tubulin suppressor-like RCC1 family protein
MYSHRLQAIAILLLGLLNIPAYAGPASGPTLVLEAKAEGLSRLEVRFTVKDKELSRFEFKGGDGLVVGAVTLPGDVGASYEITGYDMEGRVSHSGKGPIPAQGDNDRPLALPVPPTGDADGFVVTVTHERIALTVKPGDSNQFNVHADFLDPFGNPPKIDPLDIRWGLTDGRDLKLLPNPADARDVVLVPNKGVTLERLCVTPPEVYACLPNSHCYSVKVCSDPWTTVSAGNNHTCALTKSGLAYCWGTNFDGQLGAPSTTSCSPNTTFSSDCSTRPLAVVCPAGAPCRFTQIAAGQTMTAAIDTNGDAWWWGRGGVAHHKVSATFQGNAVKFALITAGFGHACAISSSRSEIWCWGTNGRGESGLPAGSPWEVPDWQPNRVLVPFTFKKVVAGGEHTCALGSAGTDVVCWGFNGDNQTSGTTYSQNGQFYFQQFGGLTQIQDIAASGSASCAALGWGNGVRCWGNYTPTTQELASFGTPEHVTVGFGQVCALSGQTASCMGTNNWGELGIGVYGSQAAAVPVKAPPPLYSVLSAGASHTCGITPDGNAYCWGNNQSGQVGNGSAYYSVKVPTLVVKP